MKAKYINPFTDFGFKKIFGEEASKPLLIDFLNSILPQAHQIKELSFNNWEQLGTLELYRKAIFDIYCENQNGEKFIVELQKAKQNYFKKRTNFYSTFPIREQAEKGNWNFNLAAVYCVGILDFTFKDYESESQKSEVVHTVKLKNQNGNVLYDKLTYIYFELPNFKLEENELKTNMDKWLFFIKHLEDFQSIPQIFRNSVFEIAFQKAELASFNTKEMDAYEHSLKHYRDLKNVIDTAFENGKLKGMLEVILEEKKQMAKKAIQIGININQIIELTGLPEEEINNL
ncbi:MAG: Rpn family recombination-promoting nuclease/putative transposase [Bacteroidota bacterium]|nr:Rpn family recombination-promoting nuclease/putative transposase [Bacteroidota bacterium]